jgi:lipid-binding SYLF domain-containing protein
MNGFCSRAAVVAILGLLVIGCSTEPQSDDDRQELQDNVTRTLKHLKSRDATIDTFLKSAYGYALFPYVGKGAFIAGGAYGHGEVFEKDQFIGYADITEATIGAQAGGQSFTEMLVFQTRQALDEFKEGRFAFAADASAVVLRAGAAQSASYDDGVAVFVEPKAGFMIEAAIGGQSFSFQPK